MPAYNSKRYVAASIESVLRQTLGDFELCIVDDGSTDGTEAILRRCAERDPRIRVNRRPHTGIVGALNDGLAMARGELVARMDADDICLPQRFEKQVAFLREHPDCVCVGTQVETIDPYGTPLARLEHALSHEEIDRQLLSGRGFAMVHPSVMMRRHVVAQVGGYRRQYELSEDLDLFLRLAEIGTVANLPEVLLQYRIHYKSINHQQHERQRAIKHDLMAEAYARRGIELPAEMAFSRKVPAPQYEQTCTWGWGALKKGYVPAARRHAMDALRLRPFKVDSWRLLYCALRGG
jgi:glycosyltransferase involved in cell wall biosynthesis